MPSRLHLTAAVSAFSACAPAANADTPTGRSCGTANLPTTGKTELRFVSGNANCKKAFRMARRWDRGKPMPATWHVSMARENNEHRLFSIFWTTRSGKVRAHLVTFDV